MTFMGITDAIGWTLLHSLWQGSVIVFGLLACFKLFSIRAPQQRYWLGLFAMILILSCSVYTFDHYYHLFRPGHYTDPERSTHQGASGMGALLYASGIPFYRESLNIKWENMRQHLSAYTTPMTVVWLLGTLLHSIKWVGGLLWVRRLRHQYCSPVTASVKKAFDMVSERFPLGREVNVLTSDRIDVPMTIGYLKPIILVPAGLMSGMETWQMEAIMAHELAHIQRGDYLINILHSLVEVLFFFHPAVWLLSRIIRKEREHCCDDLAVSTIQHSSLAYAKALHQLEQLKSSDNIMTMQLMKTKNELLLRIKRLMNPGVQRTKGTEKAASAFLLILTLITVSWYAEKAEARLMAPITLFPEPREWGDNILMLGDTTIEEEAKEMGRMVYPDEVEEEVPDKEEAPLEEVTPIGRVGSYKKTVIITIDKEGNRHEETVESGDPSLMGGFVFDDTYDFILEEPPMVSFFDLPEPLDVTVLRGRIKKKLRLQEDLEYLGEDLDMEEDPFFSYYDNPSIGIDTLDEEDIEELKASVKIYEREIRALRKEMDESYEELAREFEETFSDHEGNRREERAVAMVERKLKRLECSLDKAEMKRELANSRGKVSKKMNKYFHDPEYYWKTEKWPEERTSLHNHYSVHGRNLERVLVRDGYLKEGEKIKKMVMTDSSMKINGKKIKEQDRLKYERMISY